MKSARLGESQGCHDAADHISGLTDDLLHYILSYLHSAPAAAQTSVLSRRWRSVWKQIPDLIFLEESSPDAVDAALAAHTAPTLDKLAVVVAKASGRVSAARVAAWLRFASRRDAQEAHVVLSCKEPPPSENEEEEELEVPLLESAVMLTANLVVTFRLRLPPAGSFAELRLLILTLAAVSGDGLSRVVSTQCPCLCVLKLAMLNLVGDISIRSDSLRAISLRVVGKETQLEVTAPSLESFVVHSCSHRQVRITAPKLTEVEWDDAYDPDVHRLLDTGRHLHKLVVTQWSPMPPLLERFESADELSLHLAIPPFAWAYNMFLQNTSKIPKSKVLTMGLKLMGHATEPSMLHLLRRCGSTTKLVIELIHMDTSTNVCPTLICPCHQPDRLRTENVALDSLEEVEIHFFTGADDEVNLVKLLLMCKKDLKSMTINVADDFSLSEEVRGKIHGFAHPNTKLEMGGSSSHKRDICMCKDHDWY
ncbi:putative F-box/LRR-repeat protein At4g15060 isoform X2 [Lolium perenne]|uniref:putative F-box/LRR-repeat protein At4g15060 isoform X2 n=1 Tax=Lolium perenne TaxID=4522 RepID=UPI0021F591D1|nr:putative FBD-associated F-box protein At5g56440 isoform X2 [Lolium perenne]